MSLDIWNKYHNTALFLSNLGALYFQSLEILLVTFVMSILFASCIARKQEQVLNPANLTSLIRFFFLTGAMMISDSHPWFLVMLLFFLILDGLDGWIARKTRCQTSFGAYFDMELDSLGIMVLGIYLAFKGNFQPLILLAAAARPLMTMIKSLVWPDATLERRSQWGRILFVVFYLSLVAANIQMSLLTTGIAVFVSLLILYSFYLDGIFFVKQQRRRNEIVA